MPRPAIKRNRLPKTPSIPSQEITNPRDTSGDNDEDFENTAYKPPSGGGRSSSQHSDGALNLDIAQQAASRTPTAKPQEHTAGPSPTEEHLATSSRPNARARGYSSTLSLGRKGDMSSRIPGTPAFESSILSNFRRRPRQPSILQMVQAEDGSSDLDDDDDFLGGLSPEDESTPLNLARGKSLIARRGGSSRSGTPVSPSTGGSRKRKRVCGEFQVPQSPSGVVGNTQSDSQVSGNHNSGDAAFVNSPEPSEHAETLSHTMAAPLSSSPIHRPYHTDAVLGTGATAGHMMETIAANRNPVHLSTETLQDRALPRRRRRQLKHRDTEDFEVPSDEDDYDAAGLDEDELSYLPLKPLHSQRKQAQKPKALTGGAKDAARRPRSTTKGSKLPYGSKTYSSHGPGKVGTEKENRGGNAPSASSLPTKLNSLTSEELKSQAMKFAEIDKWQMDFEDVIISGSQAS